VPLDHASCPQADSSRAPRIAWDSPSSSAKHGYRNAQATVIAPTGTIGLVMDCDTTGIEPDFALVKFKKLAGGGYFKIINRAVPEALRTLGYRESEIAEIEAYAVGHGSLNQRAGASTPTLKAKGFTDEKIAEEGQGGAAVRLRHQVRLQQVDARRGLPARHPEDHRRQLQRLPAFDLLPALGFSKQARSRPPTCMSAAR
jgi:ribonucleoside-diphosphate reductase alpha chain